jgi:cell fate regulator YaaT (PSP1 superfamily)
MGVRWYGSTRCNVIRVSSKRSYIVQNAANCSRISTPSLKTAYSVSNINHGFTKVVRTTTERENENFHISHSCNNTGIK